MRSWMEDPNSFIKILRQIRGFCKEFAKKHILLRICLKETSIVLVLIDVFSWFNLVSFISRVMQIEIMEIEGMVQQPHACAGQSFHVTSHMFGYSVEIIYL